MRAGEQAGEQADDPAAGDEHPAVAHAVAELHVRAAARRARPPRAARRWRRSAPSARRTRPAAGRARRAAPCAAPTRRATCPVRWPYVSASTSPSATRVGAALHDPRALHVAHRRDRQAARRHAGQEHAPVGVPGGVQVGVGALEEGQLGAGGQPGEQRVDAELAVGAAAPPRSENSSATPGAATPMVRTVRRARITRASAEQRVHVDGPAALAGGAVGRAAPTAWVRSASSYGTGGPDAPPRAARRRTRGPPRAIGSSSVRATEVAVDEQLVVGQRPLAAARRSRPSAHQLHADVVAPVEHAAGRDGADGAGGEAQQDARRGRDVGARPVRALPDDLERLHALDLADEVPGEVDQVGGLLDELAAASRCAATTRARPGVLSSQVAVSRCGGQSRSASAAACDDAQRAPVVADAGEQPALAHAAAATAAAPARSTRRAASPRRTAARARGRGELERARARRAARTARPRRAPRPPAAPARPRTPGRRTAARPPRRGPGAASATATTSTSSKASSATRWRPAMKPVPTTPTRSRLTRTDLRAGRTRSYTRGSARPSARAVNRSSKRRSPGAAKRRAQGRVAEQPRRARPRARRRRAAGRAGRCGPRRRPPRCRSRGSRRPAAPASIASSRASGMPSVRDGRTNTSAASSSPRASLRCPTRRTASRDAERRGLRAQLLLEVAAADEHDGQVGEAAAAGRARRRAGACAPS